MEVKDALREISDINDIMQHIKEIPSLNIEPEFLEMLPNANKKSCAKNRLGESSPTWEREKLKNDVTGLEKG